MHPVAVTAASIGAVALGSVAWGFAEAHAFTVRQVTVPCLEPGSKDLRLLQISDLHLTPRQGDKVAWVAGLAQFEPDLVVLTGDNLGHAAAVPHVAEALASLLPLPGVFVFGSNDYFGPRKLNPFQYFAGPSKVHPDREILPTEDLRRVLLDAGWIDLNNARATLDLAGVKVSFVGLDDPHIGRDKMPVGKPKPADLHLGVVHAPYARALAALEADGAALILAGHTHGGQVCVPFYGALVTNCDLPRGAAKGLSVWPADAPSGSGTWLHVSAGLGTSPFAPVRFACRPEATLLTLTAHTA